MNFPTKQTNHPQGLDFKPAPQLSELRRHEANLTASQTQIEAVNQSISLPVRKMDIGEYYEMVAEELAMIIDSYFGAKHGTTGITTAECAEVFLERYGNMAISELKQAARFAFSPESQCDIRAFYGQFTVGMFIEMLNAWKSHRDKIKYALDKKIREESELAEKIKSDEVKRAQFADYATAWLHDRCLNQDISSYQDIPYEMANYFRVRLAKEMPEDHKIKLREAASEIAIQEMRQMSMTAIADGNALKAKMLKKVLDNIENDFDPIITYAKPIYIRMMLLSHINGFKATE